MHHAVAASTLALALLASRAVQAEPILYVETTVASGQLGNKAFKDRETTVFYLSDTANVGKPVPFFIQDVGGTVGFYVAGIGAGLFSGGQAVALVFPSQNGFAIGANSTNPDLAPPGTNGPGGNAQGIILGTNSPALAGYGLTTSVGPVMGPGVLQSDTFAGGNGTPATFATTSGDLTLDKAGTVRFTATLLKPR